MLITVPKALVKELKERNIYCRNYRRTQKKVIGTDEVDYEDGPEEETHDGELSEEIEGDEDGSDVDANENYNNVTDANNSE